MSFLRLKGIFLDDDLSLLRSLIEYYGTLDRSKVLGSSNYYWPEGVTWALRGCTRLGIRAFSSGLDEAERHVDNWTQMLCRMYILTRMGW